jgi:hypothetical protein
VRDGSAYKGNANKLAKFKDHLPVGNSDNDPLYSVKLELLIYGYESLGNSTYQEWSKGVVSRIGARKDYSDHYNNLVECLTWAVPLVQNNSLITSYQHINNS